MAFTRWQQATLDGLQRYCRRHGTRLVRRSALIDEELPAIAEAVGSVGRTPAYTLSRALQELRKFGLLHHVERGVDLLLDSPIAVEAEDLPDAAIVVALDHDGLLIADTPTADVAVVARRRRGQAKVRERTLANYRQRCGLCDVAAAELLVASHVVRWGDDPVARGRLSNVLCLCRMHDALFEYGYIGFADDLRLVVKPAPDSVVVAYLQRTADRLRPPLAHPPAADYLRSHRHRVGLERPT